MNVEEMAEAANLVRALHTLVVEGGDRIVPAVLLIGGRLYELGGDALLHGVETAAEFWVEPDERSELSLILGVAWAELLA